MEEVSVVEQEEAEMRKSEAMRLKSEMVVLGDTCGGLEVLPRRRSCWILD